VTASDKQDLGKRLPFEIGNGAAPSAEGRLVLVRFGPDVDLPLRRLNYADKRKRPA